MKCRFCTQEAAQLTPQSTDLGNTVDWVPTCVFHLDGWWESCDLGTDTI